MRMRWSGRSAGGWPESEASACDCEEDDSDIGGDGAKSVESDGIPRTLRLGHCLQFTRFSLGLKQRSDNRDRMWASRVAGGDLSQSERSTLRRCHSKRREESTLPWRKS